MHQDFIVTLPSKLIFELVITRHHMTRYSNICFLMIIKLLKGVKGFNQTQLYLAMVA